MIRLTRDLFQYAIDDVMRHEWLAIVLADVPVDGVLEQVAGKTNHFVPLQEIMV